jgi:transcription antitermination protein NusB
MGSRRKARVIAFQSIYGLDMNPNSEEEVLSFHWIDSEKRKGLDETTLAFARLLVQGVIEHLEGIDDYIKKQLKRWDFSRLNRVDLAILRVSVYAILFQNDIPKTVTIDEAIDIAKEFGTDDSYRFVNGVLDGIVKRLAVREDVIEEDLEHE